MQSIKNGKCFLNHRFSSLVVVEFKYMRPRRGGGTLLESIWRANCDCDASGKNFVLGTTRDFKRKQMCEDCQRGKRRGEIDRD